MNKLEIQAEDKIQTMSFGARIKLNLVVALAHRPRLLLLDEPTIGLDAVSKRAVFGELLKAVQDEERTVLISSHGLADLERSTDHIGFIKNGQLLLTGSTDSLINRFQLCDFETQNPMPSVFPEGIYRQPSGGDRIRVVIDRQAEVGTWIKDHGLVETSSTAMNLEDLFIALART